MMKDGIKRTALNDKATLVNRALARDDANTQGKISLNAAACDKISVLPLQKKANVLNQPAQRPQGAAALKDKTNTLLQPTQLVPLKTTGEEKEKPSQIIATQKSLSRRNTMANFKEYSGALVEKPLLHSQKPLPSTSNPISSTTLSTTTFSSNNPAPLAPVHRDLNTKPSKKILKKVDEELSTTTNGSSQSAEVDMVRTTVLKPIATNGPSILDAAAEVKKNNVAYANVGALKENLIPDINFVDNDSGKITTSQGLASLVVPFPPSGSSESTLASTNALLTELVAAQNAKVAPSQPLTVAERVSIYTAKTKGNVTEPEEYWDEPSEPENFDDEGFVTARSNKSATTKGDGNTTGNATMILVPKMNAKIRKELDAAARVIESMKTIEDIEDEAWDTTMVAEYGDEIFQHMKYLEVCSVPTL